MLEGDREVALQPLPLAVLVYLTIGGPKERTHLAELFWSQSSNSLNSLSSALNRIREAAPEALWTQGPGLVGSNLGSDVADLKAAAEVQDFVEVERLYSAPFLGGLRLRKFSIEFEEWMLESRASIAATVELNLLRRARSLLEAERHAACGEVAEKAWGIVNNDGVLSPDLFSAYHQMLAMAGNPAAQAVRATAAEFGIELQTIEPVALTVPDELQAPTNGFAVTASRPSVDLPIFGYEAAQIALANSVETQPVTTLIGLGGSGKTRLAADYFSSAKARDRFNQSYWISLRELEDPELLGPTIAAGIGIRPTQPVAAQLPDEPVLLVLDNFEHLLTHAHVVAELAAGSPQVRILATSRTPLGLTVESQVQLSGLAVSDGADLAPATELFLAAARRAGATEARLSSEHAVEINEVCRRLGGHPLALELAGAWTPLLTSSEILAAIDRDDELLGSDVGLPRSMSVVLDESWAVLSDQEQRTLQLLSTFAGGCATREIGNIPHLSMVSIRRLVQRSMVGVEPEGRVRLHALIQRFSAAKLASDPVLQAEFQRIHSKWCCEYVWTNHVEAAIDGGGRNPLVQTELANLTAAWTRSVQTRDWELHRASTVPLAEFFAESGRVAEGIALFRPAVQALRTEETQIEDLLAEMLDGLGWLTYLSADNVSAKQLLAEALSVCPPHSLEIQAKIMRSLGYIDLTEGQTDRAESQFNKALNLLTGLPATRLNGKLFHDLGQAHLFAGDRMVARTSFRAALDVGRQVSDPVTMAGTYLSLGNVETDEHPARAVVLLEEGRTIAEAHDLDHIGSYFPYALGLARLRLGQPDVAEGLFDDGIKASTEMGHPMQVCANHIGRAKSRLMKHTTVDAVEDLQTATRLAIETDCWPYMMWAAIIAARTAAAAGSVTPLGLELLSLAWHHPATHNETQNEATEALASIYDKNPVDCEEVAASIGEARLDDVGERILELLLTIPDAPG